MYIYIYIHREREGERAVYYGILYYIVAYDQHCLTGRGGLGHRQQRPRAPRRRQDNNDSNGNMINNSSCSAKNDSII